MVQEQTSGLSPYQQRARQLYDYMKKQKGTNQTDFARLIKRTQGYVSKVISGGRDSFGRPVEFSDDVVERLQHTLGLNIAWYESGEGEILLMDKTEEQNFMNNSFDKIPLHRVIVVAEPAFASYTEHKSNPQYIRSLPTEELPLDLYAKGGPIIKIMVSGDSMASNFNHGEYVFCSRFEYSDALDFQMRLRNGFVYIIVMKGRDPMLKRIFHHSDEQRLWCYSDNKDQQRYRPFDVALAEIEEMWYAERKYGGQFPPPDFLMDSPLDTLPQRVQKLENDFESIQAGLKSLSQGNNKT